ncbi:MAG: hypothetical protein JSS00_13285 [Proteobacteria bacterium]|nr:hypothetical protein [Pseudomonadota bacterium]
MVVNSILFLHLLGLMMGAGGGFGSMIVMRVALRRPPEQANALRSVGPALGRFSSVGLIVMLITGFALVFLKYDGFGNLSPLFWVKMAFVASLTLAAITLELTYGAVKRGNMEAVRRLPALGPWAGLSSLLAVAFAVFAFH